MPCHNGMVECVFLEGKELLTAGVDGYPYNYSLSYVFSLILFCSDLIHINVPILSVLDSVICIFFFDKSVYMSGFGTSKHLTTLTSQGRDECSN